MLGRAHYKLPTSITIGIKSVQETLEEADEYLGRGFRILKVKLGRCAGKQMWRSCFKLRERFGASVLIRVDPNQAYSHDEVVKFCDATAAVDVEFLEQPMAAGDIDAMRTLPDAIKHRLAADETLLRESDAIELIAPPRACGLIQHQTHEVRRHPTGWTYCDHCRSSRCGSDVGLHGRGVLSASALRCTQRWLRPPLAI